MWLNWANTFQKVETLEEEDGGKVLRSKNFQSSLSRELPATSFKSGNLSEDRGYQLNRKIEPSAQHAYWTL